MAGPPPLPAPTSLLDFRVQRLKLLNIALVSWLVAALAGAAAAAEVQPIDFNRQVRPILSERCFLCHGPDAGSREAELRLDVRESAVEDRGGYAAIAPSDAVASELLARVKAEDDSRMPPPGHGPPLPAEEVAVLERWIAEGAPYAGHWAFETPRRPDLPKVRQQAWVRNPIDQFVLARLEQEGLKPSAEAPRETLIRRLSLDLTGLPPGLEEVDRFLADDSPDAYEQLVDRLLASPHYGERMALPWLYAARYADTNGYQSDGARVMWRWRDWVIEAFNRNLPYDQFTVEQLAGDLLPGATLDQQIATGFNRNHRGNSEGGIIAEEYLVEYVVDRVETTAAVWLGLTAGCARCHDHKYDPLTQREFYQLYAYFNSIPELGRVVRVGNSPPHVKSPTPAMQKQLDQLDERLAAAQAQVERDQHALADAQTSWEAALPRDVPLDWTITEGLVLHEPLDGTSSGQVSVANAERKSPRAARYLGGALGASVEFDGGYSLVLGERAGFDKEQPFTLAAWVHIPADGGGAVIAKMDDANSSTGYELFIEARRVQLNLVNRWLDDALRIESIDALEPERWHHVAATYAAGENPASVRLYIDGRLRKTRTLLATLSNPIKTEQPLRIGGRSQSGQFRGRIDDVRIYDRVLPVNEVGVIAAQRRVDEIAAIAEPRRSDSERAKIRACYLAEYAPAELIASQAEAAKAKRQRDTFFESIPTTMVMQELPEPKPAFLLTRGAYDRPGEQVERGVPSFLPPLRDEASNDRLALARWLVDPQHPLTARVTVNRFWQMLLGRGLVETSEDFGSQGQWPSHPELLDWLARELVDSGWDVKRFVRLIVTSATYRQSSQVTPQLVARDPANVLLARGARFRLSAELLRDQALAASGLLVPTIGGPSVKPYQPEGIWEEIGNVGVRYDQGHGDDLYRRSLYTYWKRTAPPPSMMTFDATSREICTVRFSRTNTPLQALDLMNDVIYVEAARMLAERAMREASADPRERIAHAFRLVLARRPSEAELVVLTASHQRQLQHYTQHAEQAVALLKVGERPADAKLDPAELAALANVCGLILNLDEAVTKE